MATLRRPNSTKEWLAFDQMMTSIQAHLAVITSPIVPPAPPPPVVKPPLGIPSKTTFGGTKTFPA